jgi:hypothetical protein
MKTVLLSLAISMAVVPRQDCIVTDAMRAEALTLSWPDFDQNPDSPAGMRKLSAAGCFREAAKLQEYYIANRQGLSPKEVLNSHFHIGQNYANASMPNRALRYFRLSLDPNQPASSGFDWNTYVLGVIAFFENDRETLLQKMSVLRASSDPGNQINGRALARMNKCFGRRYREVWTAECDVP